METLAAFVGTVLGAALKQCAPILKTIIMEAIREATIDTAEVGRPNSDDPNQRIVVEWMRNPAHSPTAGDGDASDQAVPGLGNGSGG